MIKTWIAAILLLPATLTAAADDARFTGITATVYLAHF